MTNFVPCTTAAQSNTSCSVKSTHYFRGGWWWYSSRGWTFLPIFCCILLLCDRWWQRSSLTKWRLSWKCVQSKGVELNFSVQKKWHPLTFIDVCWTFVVTNQWMWVQWGSGTFQHWRQWCERQAVFQTAMQIFFKCSTQALVHCW